MQNCHVYFSGSNFYAVPINPRPEREKKSVYRDEVDERFDDLYNKFVDEGFRNTAANRPKLFDRIKSGFGETYTAEEGFDARIKKKLIDKIKSAYARAERAKRKAHLSLPYWTHFFTQTYNPAVMTEEEFVKVFDKFLANAHSNNGWMIMGAYERSPELQRLHFHGLARIPFGGEIGKIIVVSEYNPLKKKMEKRFMNTHLDEAIGRSDVQPINEFELIHGSAVDYILKYSDKSGSKMRYSRGIPTSMTMGIEEMFDVSGVVEKFVDTDNPEGKVRKYITTKLVLFKEKFIKKIGQWEETFNASVFAREQDGVRLCSN